jgi:protein-S-isoprenylcysteine O-methyltransferase Ste14
VTTELGLLSREKPKSGSQRLSIPFSRNPVRDKIESLRTTAWPSWKSAAISPEKAMITSTVCEITWFAGLVAWYIIRYPFQRRSKKVSVTKSLFGWRESGVLALAFVGLWVIPFIYALTGLPSSLDRHLIPAVAVLGVTILCGALLLFFRSHADLGRNWSISLQIRDEHRLVTTGVYRVIRHPMYSSFFLLAIAQLMLLPNWFAGAAGLIGISLLYAFRVRQEERMMVERFGAEYRDYMTHTGRLIPPFRSFMRNYRV